MFRQSKGTAIVTKSTLLVAVTPNPPKGCGHFGKERLRRAGSRRRGLNPLQSSWAQDVVATLRRCRWPSAGAAGEIIRANCSKGHSGTGLAKIWEAARSTVRRRGRRSGRERRGAQSRQGAIELILPGPALEEMQGETAPFAGEAPGQREAASSEGLGGRHRFGKIANEILAGGMDACGRVPAAVGRPVRAARCRYAAPSQHRLEQG